MNVNVEYEMWTDMGVRGVIDELEMNNREERRNENIKVNVGVDTSSKGILDEIQIDRNVHRSAPHMGV